MSGMYPNNETVNIFGNDVIWPGVDPVTGKFTNGDFTNPLVKPSFIPADTINLILDNLESFIEGLGLEPNNTETDQLLNCLQVLIDRIYPIGSIFTSTTLSTPAQVAAAIGGTWEAFAPGRTLVGVGLSDRYFAPNEWGGASWHALSEAEMPPHDHLATHSAPNSIGDFNGLLGSPPPPASLWGYIVALLQNSGNPDYPSGLNGHTTAAGSGHPHNNLQPYTTVYFYRRIG